MREDRQIILVDRPGDDSLLAKYQFFTQNREEQSREITNEESALEEEENLNKLYAEVAGTTFKDFTKANKSAFSQFRQNTAGAVLTEDLLKVEIDDPFHEKKYEQEKKVFVLKRNEDKIDTELRGYQTPPGSKSTPYVQSAAQSPWATQQAAGPNYSSGHSSSTTNQSAYTPPTKDGEAPNLFTQTSRIIKSVEEMAYRSRPFQKSKEEEGWGRHTKKGLFSRVKRWFKSDAGRITVRVAALATLQLGMALIAGKYSVNGPGQAIAFIGMILGTFFISKDLQALGFDARGLGI